MIGLGLKTGIDFLRHEGKQKKYREKVDQFKHSFNAEYLIGIVMDNKNKAISDAKKVALDDCLVPLQKKLQEVIDNKESREKMRKEAEANVQNYQKELQSIESQLSEISNMSIVKQYGVM